MPDWITGLLIIVAGLIIGSMWVGIFAYFVWLKCPACKQFNALVPTGKFEKTRRLPVRIVDEYRCKYCGHLKWKQRAMGGG